MNPLKRLFKEKNINVASFARSINTSQYSVYTATKETSTVWRMGIDLFMKIAHGLGMTADELYEELERISLEENIEIKVVEEEQKDD